MDKTPRLDFSEIARQTLVRFGVTNCIRRSVCPGCGLGRDGAALQLFGHLAIGD
jgi:hypothetical protein